MKKTWGVEARAASPRGVAHAQLGLGAEPHGFPLLCASAHLVIKQGQKHLASFCRFVFSLSRQNHYKIGGKLSEIDVTLNLPHLTDQHSVHTYYLSWWGQVWRLSLLWHKTPWRFPSFWERSPFAELHDSNMGQAIRTTKSSKGPAASVCATAKPPLAPSIPTQEMGTSSASLSPIKSIPVHDVYNGLLVVFFNSIYNKNHSLKHFWVFLQVKAM